MTESEAQIRAALESLHPDPHALIEVRPLMPGGTWWQALYDDRERLMKSVLGCNGIDAEAVYWSINRISPSLSDRVTNSLAPAKRGQCIGNADIDRITNLFLDFDCKHGDRAAVLKLAKKVEEHLTSQGWPQPLFVDSGTGYYHFYRIDQPATEAKTIKTIINNLADRFDEPGVAVIDRKCANIGRVARVPGTYNIKHKPRLATIIREAA